MAYVVAEPCVGCTFTDCVEVCPVDCFYVGPNFIAIDPDECIDCAACVSACPVEAIYAAGDLPREWTHYLGINADLAARWRMHNIVEKQPGSPASSDLSCADRSRSAADIRTWGNQADR